MHLGPPKQLGSLNGGVGSHAVGCVALDVAAALRFAVNALLVAACSLAGGLEADGLGALLAQAWGLTPVGRNPNGVCAVGVGGVLLWK